MTRPAPMTRAARLSLIAMGPRSAAALVAASLVGLLAFGWPFFVPVGQESGAHAISHTQDAPWLFVAVLPLLAAVVLAQLSEGGMDAKVVALLGMLTAVGAGLRAISPGVAGLEPGFFLLVLAGYAFGPGFGFVLGSLSIVAGGLLTAGVGPWMPFQMFAAGWVGAGAGLLPGAARLHGTVRAWQLGLLGAYGTVAGLAYGLVMNIWFWPFTANGTGLSFIAGDPLAANLARYGAFWLATSLGWDLPRGVITALLVLAFGRGLLRAFARVSRLAAFDATPAFPGGDPQNVNRA
ncbi:energy-coupling factor transport system substrate-specific component [Raineyella antarctica]|uniref:Energy-coupling factor transport system substrate-specific component n=1 Tax=Raineyella antarctica TaxID=1577474 RepID=A0A1G6H915_9ACTN|nr:ECF transporter S component [Raineyella antarctica]SDB90445.1 energy-coupling factor transport system substrate-specific component [Raineyella antarctica]